MKHDEAAASLIAKAQALLVEAISVLQQQDKKTVKKTAHRSSSEFQTCVFDVAKRTEKAICIDFIEPREIKGVWIPQSFVENPRIDENNKQVAEIPKWILQDKKII